MSSEESSINTAIVACFDSVLHQADEVIQDAAIDKLEKYLKGNVSDFLNLPEILDLPRPRRRNSPLPRVLCRAHKPPGSRSRDVRAPVHGSVVLLEYFLI